MWRRDVPSEVCAPVVVGCADACLSPPRCLFPAPLPRTLLCLFLNSDLASLNTNPPPRDVFIPAVSLSRRRLTLHPSVLPSIPRSLHPPILAWSFVAQQRGKASDNKQPCVCVCRATDYTGETRCSLFLACSHSASHVRVFASVLVFHGHALTGATCEVFCTLHRCHEASMLRILNRAALAQCASHTHSDTLTHTHTYRHGAPLWIHCCSAKGFPMIKASLLLVQVLKKVKTERRRRLEGNVVGFGAYMLFMAEQKCVSPEPLLQKHLP